jgi:superfamily II DNA or RNA helicase
MIDREVAVGEAQRCRTLVFATSVAHAERLAEIINRWLPENPAEHIDGTMSMHLRRDKLRRFATGRLQYLINCMITTEGFDDPGVELVVMARPTKSRALFCQMVGRGTRPADNIADVLGTIENADDRRACIQNSIKPSVEILDFVGNSGRHKLVSTLDLLGDGYSEEVLAAARQKVQQGAANVQDVLEETKEEIERKKREAEEAKRKREEAAERRRQAEAAKRAGLVATTQYELSSVDSFDQSAPSIGRAVRVAPKHLNILRKAKVPDVDIARLTPEAGKRLSQEIVRRWKLKLCSYKQAKLLQKCGWSKNETFNMTYADASAAIDHLKTHGWRRQAVAA